MVGSTLACSPFTLFPVLYSDQCSTGAFRDSGAGAGAGAGLGNFRKRWVRVRRDSAIKKLLKIFLFIFSIYFYY